MLFVTSNAEKHDDFEFLFVVFCGKIFLEENPAKTVRFR